MVFRCGAVSILSERRIGVGWGKGNLNTCILPRIDRGRPGISDHSHSQRCYRRWLSRNLEPCEVFGRFSAAMAGGLVTFLFVLGRGECSERAASNSVYARKGEKGGRMEAGRKDGGGMMIQGP